MTVQRIIGIDRSSRVSGFALREIEHVRLLHTHRLDRYLPAESDLDKNG